MDCRDFGQDGDARYNVTLALAVEDATALWHAAADRALAAPGMTLADVLDTIGPREDPDIAECIAMLVVPVSLPGCGLDHAAVMEVPQMVAAPAQILPLPIGHGAARLTATR